MTDVGSALVREGVAGRTGGILSLPDRIADKRGEFLLFAITPPRRSTPPERVTDIADRTLSRLSSLALDGVVLYDIDDESDRNASDRPFPFVPTIDPADYLSEHLSTLGVPAVVYRAVGKYRPEEIAAWAGRQDPRRSLSVFVGNPTKSRDVHTSLADAHRLRFETAPELLVGGVAIPERHARRGDEHVRMLSKQRSGSSFFVTQVIYDVNAAKNLVSDYHYECTATGATPVPIVFTFSVIGGTGTLEFMRWLGVDVPRWIENELTHSDNPLLASHEHSLAAARDLVFYCRRLGVPVGLNVESVSTRLVEIEQSVELAQALSGLLIRDADTSHR
jgi:hypothetical protein